MLDIVIIGGGIHGAACAQAAAEKGYRVLVLEQYEKPGLGTSSKSSKLIHGGLRYLESGQFKLVKECLAERKHLLNSAPDLVELIPFYIPVYKNTSRSPWLIRLGLIIYSLFSRKAFKTIPKSDWSNLDGLNTKDLVKVFQYYDAQTNDLLLTEHVMSRAMELGTKLETQAFFESAQCDNNVCDIHYKKNGKEFHIQSKIIINTAGPWANHVLNTITPKESIVDVDLVLGTHIIVAGQLEKGMYYLESPTDKRAVFVMPWQGNIMVGTTETFFHDSPEKVSPPENDIHYLIDVYNHYFSKTVSRKDVMEAFAGLRVLPKASGSAFARKRDTLIHYQTQNPMVFTLYGGKLTAHRATANKLIKIISKLRK